MTKRIQIDSLALCFRYLEKQGKYPEFTDLLDILCLIYPDQLILADIHYILEKEFE
jgi:hypothetical protein